MTKLRIAFLTIGNSRRSGYLDGDTLRSGGSGGSGTDTTNILVAEYLASQGHEVVVAFEKLEPMLEELYRKEGREPQLGRLVRGVYYTNLEFDNIDNKEFDILHTCLWFKDYDTLPIKVTKALIYHNHMQWVYSIAEMIKFVQDNNLKIGFVDISLWQREKTQGTVDHAVRELGSEKVFQTLIPNPLMDDVIKEVLATNTVKKPHKFIFHAGWGRGGNVAVEAVRQLPFEDKEFHAFDYLMCTHAHQDPFFHMHNGVDKKTLFNHLAESQYFIYPLYTPYQDIHMDTFSCVVAEAIALGCVVITYPLAALPENFDSYTYWLPPPADDVSFEELDKQHLPKDLDGKFKNTDYIVQAINELDSRKDLRDQIVAGGYTLLDRFSQATVGGMWVNFINEMVNE